MDLAFEEVIAECAKVPRVDQDGTWITADMQRAYCQLHRLGIAHSVEAWADDGELAGGIYGLAIGGAFFGESMFARSSNASKVAFVALVQQLAIWGFTMIDCQVFTEHLQRFGARGIPLNRFRGELAEAVSRPWTPGQWSFDAMT